MKLDVLIIDDHAAMIEGYKSILAFNELAWKITYTTGTSLDVASDILKSNRNCFDIILLDVLLPSGKFSGLKSGIDLAILIQKHMPVSKLMMITSHTEAFVLYKIIKDINPDGLLVKSDFTAEEFLYAFNYIVAGNNYRSSTVNNGIKEILKRDVYLDAYNRQIISLLGQGIKTKNLPQHLNLSISAIDKRKAQIKDYFEIEKGTDEDIIRAAKDSGFI